MQTISYLKYLRIKKEMKQKYLSEIMDIKLSTLKAYEKDRRPIPAKYHNHLAVLFEVCSDVFRNNTITITDKEYTHLMQKMRYRVAIDKPEKPRIFDILSIPFNKKSLKDVHYYIVNKRKSKPH